MRSVYKDLVLLTMENRLLDYSELRRRVCCLLFVFLVYYISSAEELRVGKKWKITITFTVFTLIDENEMDYSLINIVSHFWRTLRG